MAEGTLVDQDRLDVLLVGERLFARDSDNLDRLNGTRLVIGARSDGEENDAANCEHGSRAAHQKSPSLTGHFTTLTLNFTSWVAVTFGARTAVARAIRSGLAPMAVSGAALRTSFTSSLPAGIVASAAVTPLAAAG